MIQSSYKYILLFTAMCSIQTSYALVTNININDIVEQAIEKHPLVLAAKSEAKSTDEGITAAELKRFPELTIETTGGTTDPVSALTIQQSIWSGGKIDRTIDQANYDTFVARANVEEQRYTIATKVLDSWQSFVKATNKKQVQVNTLEELNRFENIMSRRVNAEVSARIELDLVVNRILQAQDAYEANIQQQKIALSRMQQLIGETISKNVLNQSVDIDLLAARVDQESKKMTESTIVAASDKHPSVIKKNYEIESAKAKSEVDKANIYPQLFARYQHTYDYGSNESNNNFVVGFQYAPGAGFSSYSLARASKERVKSYQQNKEAAKREVIESLQVDYQQFITARDRKRALVSSVDGALILKESYERQFIAGKKSWLDVLNSVKELDQYENQLVEAKVDYIVAFYRLKLGLGLLPWQKGVNNG